MTTYNGIMVGVWPQEVGRKLPNQWGLYDMHGNVWEWVQDYRSETNSMYDPYPSDVQTDPMWSATGSRRVTRGGDTTTSPTDMQSTDRHDQDPDLRNGTQGARLVRIAEAVSAPVPAAENEIVFAQGDDENSEIYIMNIDGTGKTQLTSNNFADLNPALSPDRTKIAYLSGGSRLDYQDLFVMDIDGENPLKLIPEFPPSAIPTLDGILARLYNSHNTPAWSPDGSRIVFSGTESEGYNNLFVLDVNEGNLRRVTAFNAYQVNAFDPSWSPDGTKILFYHYDDMGMGNLPNGWYTIQPNGGNLTLLAEGYGNGGTWSPDGTQIALGSSPGDMAAGIYVMGADGTGMTRLGDSSVSNPRWLSDGTVYTVDGNGKVAIFTPGPAPTPDAEPDQPEGWIWKPRGLSGKTVNSLYSTSDGTLFAGTNTGLFFSQNNGVSWQETGLVNTPIHSLIEFKSVLFAGGYNEGYRSLDGGNNWTDLEFSFQFRGSRIMDFAVADDILYAAIEGWGVHASEDSGNTWIDYEGGGSGYAYSLASSGSTIYEGTDFGGIYRSEDGGRTWNLLLATGIPSDIKISGTGVIYAAAGNVYLSRDGGNSWVETNFRELRTGQNPNARALATSSGTVFVGTYYDGVYRSADEGDTWFLEDVGLTNKNVHSLHIVGVMLFAGTEDGVFRMVINDGTLGPVLEEAIPVTPPNTPPQADAGEDQSGETGDTFTLDGSRSSDPDGDALSYAWTAPAEIALSSATVARPTFTTSGAGTYQFSLVVNDGTVNSAADEVVVTISAPASELGNLVTAGDLVWEETIGPFGGKVNQLLVVDGTLYAATAAGIWRTVDKGNTWLGELNSYSVNSVAAMNSTLYVATGSQKMFSSDDGGVTWMELSRAGLNTGEYGRTYLGNLYALDGALFVSSSTDNETVQTLYRSDDGGQSWVRAGLYNSVKCEEAFGFLYAGTATNMYRSVDGGKTWVQLASEEIGAAVDFAVVGSKLYIATGARWIGSTQILGGMHVSETRGNSWERILPNASMAAINATSVAVYGNSLYVGTSYFNGTPGILRSDDGGETWESVNTGLPDLVIPDLAVSGGILFAGTNSGSVFRALLVK